MDTLTVVFIKGLVLGFSIAAPVGPIGLLCINRTLAHGFLAGVAGGLGTAVADAAYAAVAAFGLTAVASVLTAGQAYVQLAGIAVLAWLGWSTFRHAPARKAAVAGSGPAFVVLAQTFALTIANPATILSFAAMFAGLGLKAGATALHAALLVGGTFAGSMAWWIILCAGVSLLRKRITPNALAWINRTAGLVLMGFAAWLCTRLFAAQ